jgi:hypothetical protein
MVSTAPWNGQSLDFPTPPSPSQQFGSIQLYKNERIVKGKINSIIKKQKWEGNKWEKNNNRRNRMEENIRKETKTKRTPEIRKLLEEM